MQKMTVDGNHAAAYISYAFSEIAVIYPITPSTPMAELADEWQAQGKPNLFGQVPKVVQMQSEGGVAGAMHGCLTAGAMATTYTSSQGLLMMLPDMYKIAGELLPTVFHVSARAIATHALSIFGDHQDVMAARQTGFALLASSSVQECSDMALVAHLVCLKAEIPFLHFFDGFRTSHEVCKIEVPDYNELKTLVDEKAIERFRKRALSPDSPVCRGTAQNPDIYFQNREAANNYYAALPNLVQQTMDEVAKITKRHYHVFDYHGCSQAEYVVVIMGSGGSAVQETVEKLRERGEQVGVVQVRLYRPFDGDRFCAALPRSCKRIAVLDRTKEAGALGEPLYLDVCAALQECGLTHIEVVGGRYGLGSKEFTPTMVYAVFQNLKSATPKNHFTVGIHDDLFGSSLDCSTPFIISNADTVECKFYGLGSDGTVGANKNSIKIIGNHTDLYVQGYFVYDSRKSGGTTISHLRFGRTPIRAPYLIQQPDFVACHDPSYLTRYDMISDVKEGGTLLLNCPWTNLEELNAHLPPSFKQTIAKKRLCLYVINATKIADEVGLRGRTSTIMQAAFFLLTPSILPYERAVELLKQELEKTFSRKGKEVIKCNFEAVDRTKDALLKMEYPDEWCSVTDGVSPLPLPQNEYFQEFIHPVLSLEGDVLPTSAFQADGTVPTGTTKWEKHGLPPMMPRWIKENCIQCNQCSFVCPHACIRPFVVSNATPLPTAFVTKPATGIRDASFRIQVSPFDCMGCCVCANVCPAKEKALVMTPTTKLMPFEGENWAFAQTLPAVDTSTFKRNTLKGSQFYPPLFEFSYACSGCGETPYIKILTQLFGERLLIANATGCSSIYGASAPTCPYTTNREGKGPAWANSLFEDNAEFGYGMRLAQEIRGMTARSVWIIGGDGWAYDIGFGGLDHVLASGANVNVLVLDSEVYSNTGGQNSKATPMGAVARFAVQGKAVKKKNLGLMAMSYGYVYVAQVSLGADKQQLLNAFTEAEAYDGPSLIIAYSPCIAHGVTMAKSIDEEKRAVESGYWQLYRFNPKLLDEGKNPFSLDSKAPMVEFKDFLMGENRFASLKSSSPERAERLFHEAEQDSLRRFAFYQKLNAFWEELL